MDVCIFLLELSAWGHLAGLLGLVPHCGRPPLRSNPQYGCMYVWMFVCMYGCMYVWMDVCMYGCMNECVDVCIFY